LGQRTARTRIEGTGGERVRATIVVAAIGRFACVHRSIVAEGHPQHQGSERKLDQREQHDQHPQWHGFDDATTAP